MRVIIPISIRRVTAGVFLFSLLFTAPRTSGAWEIIMGMVESIEKDAGMITLRPMHAPPPENTSEKNETSADTKPPETQPKQSTETITVQFADGAVPPRIKPGKPVRLWGTFSETDPATFTAQYIRGCPFMGMHRDPTGVRSRLGRPKHRHHRGGCRRCNDGAELPP